MGAVLDFNGARLTGRLHAANWWSTFGIGELRSPPLAPDATAACAMKRLTSAALVLGLLVAAIALFSPATAQTYTVTDSGCLCKDDCQVRQMTFRCHTLNDCGTNGKVCETEQPAIASPR